MVGFRQLRRKIALFGDPSSTMRQAGKLIAFWTVLNVTLNVRYPGSEDRYWYLVPSLDVAVILVAFAVLGLLHRRVPRGLIGALTGFCILTRLLRIGDGVELRYYSRPFSVYMDLPLLPELVRLFYTTVPRYWFALASSAVLVLLVALGVVCWISLERSGALLRERDLSSGLLLFVLLLCLASPWATGDAHYHGVFGASVWPRFYQEGYFLLRGARYRAMVEADLSRARREIESNPHDLARLGGTNVELFLIESYGDVWLDPKRLGSLARQVYGQFTSELGPLGFHAVSGRLTSPTYGGSSWLAHATIGTGVQVDTQFRYRVVTESKPLTLAAVFRAADYYTVLVQPGTTRPWPEGEVYGFHEQYFAWNLGYEGPRFSWATMPDQYVVDFVQRHVINTTKRPLFIQYALVSSHAPWNLQPPLLDRHVSLENGRVYRRIPAVEFPTGWRDMTEALEPYGRSIAYDLAVLRAHLRDGVTGRGLVILLGDHQPNGDVTGHSKSFAVPVHVICRDWALIEPLLRHGFTNGMMPNPSDAALSMHRFLPTLLAVLSTGGQESSRVGRP